jgi:hypothetical protein
MSDETQTVVANVVRVLAGRRAARQDEIALALGTRTSSDKLGLALAFGARNGVLTLHMPSPRWSTARSQPENHKENQP